MPTWFQTLTSHVSWAEGSEDQTTGVLGGLLLHQESVAGICSCSSAASRAQGPACRIHQNKVTRGGLPKVTWWQVVLGQDVTIAQKREDPATLFLKRGQIPIPQMPALRLKVRASPSRGAVGIRGRKAHSCHPLSDRHPLLHVLCLSLAEQLWKPPGDWHCRVLGTHR